MTWVLLKKGAKMKSVKLVAICCFFVLGWDALARAEDHPTLVKGSRGKGEAVAYHPPARRGDPEKTIYTFQMEITGREGNAFTAVLVEPAARGRQAMEVKLKGALAGANEVALEVIAVDRGVWFPYVPKKLAGKIENGKILLEWTKNDRQPVQTKGALEAIFTVAR